MFLILFFSRRRHIFDANWQCQEFNFFMKSLWWYWGVNKCHEYLLLSLTWVTQGVLRWYDYSLLWILALVVHHHCNETQQGRVPNTTLSVDRAMTMLKYCYFFCEKQSRQLSASYQMLNVVNWWLELQMVDSSRCVNDRMEKKHRSTSVRFKVVNIKTDMFYNLFSDLAATWQLCLKGIAASFSKLG